MNNETAALLEKHFDTAFDSPNGIKKLRELILTLAMQGKLVPQDPIDRPASELLKAIEAEKKKLVKEGKIKQPKPLSEIKSEELPYDLPKSWEWVTFSELAMFINGDRGKNYPSKEVYISAGIPFINAGHLVNGLVDLNEMNYISEERFEILGSGKVVNNDILYCLRGSLGKTAVVQDIENGAIASSLVIIRLYQPESVHFVYNYLISPFGKSLVLKYDNGSAQPNLSANSIQKYYFPLPPIAEQHRIVAEIDRLMARCDELEKLRTDRTQKRTIVHTAAIDRLLTAKDDRDFNNAWSFITQHFSELYSVKENVIELRKVILQLAVMGKLVPQDPNDEPASELLKAIEVEKQQLVKTKKIKQPKPLPKIKSENTPYDLPQGWEFIRLGTITNIVRGGSPRPAGDPQFYDGNIPFLKVADLTAKNEMYLGTYTYSIKEAGLHKTRMVPPDTLMLTNSGATLGIPKICTFETTFNDGIAAFIFMNIGLYKPFLYYFLASNTSYFLNEASRGQGQPNLNTEIIGETFISLPPIAEQHRIVEKIDRLMEFCDRLEVAIEAAKTKQTELLNALMAQV